MNAHQLDGQGFIVNTIVVKSLDAFSGLVDAEIGGKIGDRIVDGVVVPAAAPQPPAQALEQIEPYRAAIQKMLDEKVKERRYYDMLNATSYASSTNPAFKAEAEACIAWRDQVWVKAYEALDLVQSGAALQPTVQGLLAMMPTLTWPEAA